MEKLYFKTMDLTVEQLDSWEAYECIGEQYLDEYCPHITMIKNI